MVNRKASLNSSGVDDGGLLAVFASQGLSPAAPCSISSDCAVNSSTSLKVKAEHPINLQSLPGRVSYLGWIITRKRQLLFWSLLLVAVVVATHVIDARRVQDSTGTSPEIRSGPWGDLQEWDMRLEQPLEYVGFERIAEDGPLWSFGTLSQQGVRDLLLSCGCTAEQTENLLRKKMEGTGSVFILKPSAEAILALGPEVRSKLYLILGGNSSNRFQASPYYIPKGDLRALFKDHGPLDPGVLFTMGKLLYHRNGYTYFSDPELVIRKIPSEKDRMTFLQGLTGQSSVLLRLLIRHKADIDKPLNYWALSMSGVLLKDLKPLLEAQRRLPQGGSISILYLLPPLARERLFTSPLPPKSDDRTLPDCHWTALNFFSPRPDSKMSDVEYASRFISENYYEIAGPGIAGDLLLLLDHQGRVAHSAVYLADDVVFTKNGINYAQPWILMRVKDLVGSFSALEPMKVAYFRRKGL